MTGGDDVTDLRLSKRALTMDRAYARLAGVLEVMRFIGQHWEHLDNPAQVLDLATQDLANAITPASAWRLLAEANGVDVDQPDK